MTRDEILAMPAGREMDALIAENVFMWKWFPAKGISYFRPETKFAYGAIKEGGAIEYLSNLENYSTDIAAAWEVVEYLKSKMYWVGITTPSNDLMRKWDWACEWTTRETAIDFVTADTAPLAICRAALLAVMDIAPSP